MTIPAVDPGKLQAPPTADAGEADEPGSGRKRRSVLTLVREYGVIFALLAISVFFSIARPDAFFTENNLKAILVAAAPLVIISVGLTVVLALGEFDLSFGSMLGLAAAVSVVLMTQHGTPWLLAIVCALGVGVVVGLVNGFLVAYAGAPSFITTLGMGTVLTGLEYLLTQQKPIVTLLPQPYLDLGQSYPLFGINSQVWIALGLILVAYVVLDRTELGRYMQATGGNRYAAWLSGIRVRWLLVLGFVAVAVAASVAGILLTAISSAQSPDMGTPYLLPAFAAAFLGSACSPTLRFNVFGTVIGALLLEVLATGLTMLQLSTAAVDIVQGAVLILAILLTRIGKVSRS